MHNFLLNIINTTAGDQFKCLKTKGNMSRTDLSKFGRVGRHISKNDVTAISAWIMILEKIL